jgi:hypothetical protein
VCALPLGPPGAALAALVAAVQGAWNAACLFGDLRYNTFIIDFC